MYLECQALSDLVLCGGFLLSRRLLRLVSVTGSEPHDSRSLGQQAKSTTITQNRGQSPLYLIITPNKSTIYDLSPIRHKPPDQHTSTGTSNPRGPLPQSSIGLPDLQLHHLRRKTWRLCDLALKATSNVLHVSPPSTQIKNPIRAHHRASVAQKPLPKNPSHKNLSPTISTT